MEITHLDVLDRLQPGRGGIQGGHAIVLLIHVDLRWYLAENRDDRLGQQDSPTLTYPPEFPSISGVGPVLAPS